jgi:hypothetical protein
MAWRLVIQPNGLFARFSTVVDDFTHYDMDEAEVLRTAFAEWDCGEETARRKIDSAKREADPYKHEGYWSAEAPSRPPLSRFRECISIVRDVHGLEAAKEREREMSAKPSPSDSKPD